jgi:hypothetical protein
VDEPAIEQRALARAGRRRERGFRVAIAKMQRDRGGFVENEVAVDQHRDAAVRVEPQVLGLFWALLARSTRRSSKGAPISRSIMCGKRLAFPGK